jgi:putative MATE family efflux protein
MQDLTTGSVSRHLLKTTGFMLVTMVFQTLYFLVDFFWVGHLGKEAVAGVAVAGNLMFVVLAISQMMAVGTTTLIAHAAGRKHHDEALLVFNQSQVLSALVGAVFFFVAGILRTSYTRALSADGETAALANDYLAWFIPAMALQFPMAAMGAALRGTGNFKPGMIVGTATVILNMILAPFLMFGWVTHHPLGVAGTALSTFIAVVVGSVWLGMYFRSDAAHLRFVPADWGPKLALWGRLLRIGLPAGTEFALMSAYLFIVYTVSRPFGSAAQAGFGIGLRIFQAGFMPVVALGFAVAPVAGQNFGARHAVRVRDTFKAAVLMSIVAMASFTVLCHVAPGAMMQVFSDDPEVIAVGRDYLQILSWSSVASGIIYVASSMFQAMGNTMPSLATSFTRIVCVAIPTLVMARMTGFQLHWIWYLSAGSVALQMTMSLLLLRREFHRRLNFERAA